MSTHRVGRCGAAVLVSLALALAGTVVTVAPAGAQAPAQTHA
jgi:hypothetical protein